MKSSLKTYTLKAPKTGIVYKINEYLNSQNSKDSQKIKEQMTEVTKQAWGEPGEMVTTYFDLSQVLIIAERGRKAAAYAGARPLNKNATLMTATVVRSDEQDNGIGIGLNKLILIRVIMREAKHNFLKFFFSSHYLVYRTANPKLYTRTAKRLPVFPSLNHRPPTRMEKELMQYVVESFVNNKKTDLERGIIYNAYSETPGLILDPQDIPWSKDKEVNRFFESELKLSEKQGNVFIVLARISPLKKLLIPFL